MSFFGAFSIRTLALRPAAAAARYGPFCKLVSTRAFFTSAPRNRSPVKVIDHVLDVGNALAAENPQERAMRLQLSKSMFASAQYTTHELLDAVRGLQTSMNNMVSEVGSLKTEIGIMKTEIGGLDNKIGGLDNKIGAMKLEVEAVKSDIGIAVKLWKILAYGLALLSAVFSVKSGLVSISIPWKTGAGGDGPQ